MLALLLALPLQSPGPQLTTDTPLTGNLTGASARIEDTTGLPLDGATDLVRGIAHPFTAPAGTWTLELRAALFDSVLLVRDADGTHIADDDDGLGETDSRVVLTIPEGGRELVVIVCARRLEVGEYELRVVAGDAPLPDVRPLTMEELGAFARQAFDELGVGSPKAVRRIQEKGFELLANSRPEQMLRLAEPAIAILDADGGEYEEQRARLLEITALAKSKMGRYLEAARDWRECAPILTQGPPDRYHRTAAYNTATAMWRAGWRDEGLRWAELANELGKAQLPDESPERLLEHDLLLSYLRVAGIWDEYLDSLGDPTTLEAGAEVRGEMSINKTLYQSTDIVDHAYSFAAAIDPLTFRVTRSGVYTIDMRTYAFDPYLVLRHADGELIAEDDDSRGLTEARLVVELEAGVEYLLEPTALHRGSGPYRVELLAGRPPELDEWERREADLAEARATLQFIKDEAAEGRGYVSAITRATDLFGALGQSADVVRVRELALEHSDLRYGPGSRASNVNRFHLANALRGDGRDVEALPLLEQVYAFELETKGPRHVPWQVINALAQARWSRGEFERAQDLFDDVYERVIAQHGPQSGDAIGQLRARARREASRGRWEEAAEIARDVLERYEATVARSSGTLRVLASMLYYLAEYESWVPEGIERSRHYAERSLEVGIEAYGERSIMLANLRNLYAFDLCYTGEPERAAEEWEFARAIVEEVQPGGRTMHLSTGADIYAVLGQNERALELATLAVDQVLEWRGGGGSFATLPEALRLRKLGQGGWNVGMLVGVGAQVPGSEAHVYERLLALKALTGRCAVETRDRVRADASEEVAALLDELQGVQSELSRAFYGQGRDEYLERLRERRVAIEDELAQAGITAIETRRASVKELSAALPPEAVLIDFHSTVRYTPERVQPGHAVTPLWWKTPRLSAWVVHPGEDEVATVDLGPTEELEELADDLGGALLAARGLGLGLTPGSGERRDALRRKLWDPLAPLVGDAERVFVSTTDFLGSVPLEVLQRDDGSYLIEHHAFVHLSDPLQLIDAGAAPAASDPSLLLVGDVDYDAREDTGGPRELLALARAPSELRSATLGSWEPLPFTLTEVEGLEDLAARRAGASDVTVLTGEEATEEALKSTLPEHAWVHVATHGFFRPEGAAAMGSAADGSNLGGLFPGLLSGLVLAGANTEPQAGREDGLLTAEELTWLDLSGCELVTLSACETGLGSARGGAGLIGLRRAFHQAGAKTVVASLWAVEDEATAKLMESFYRFLWTEGLSRSDALRAAQLEMLEDNREKHGAARPSTWGAFVLSGEWR